MNLLEVELVYYLYKEYVKFLIFYCFMLKH